MRGVSIVVCCYNSAQKLPATLEYLSRQVVPAHINWEIILVDNASTDNTAAIAKQFWQDRESASLLLIVKEDKPGLSAARHRGYQESHYDLLVFCDDDNWLQQDYVQIAYEVMSQLPAVAVVGGRSEAAFESSPPEWFKKYEKSYAVGRQYSESGDVTWRDEKLWGAGAVYRKSALDFLYSHHFSQLLSDRIGDKIVSGGDHELCCALRLAGYQLYYEDRLFFYHYMTSSRLRWEWFINFYRNASYCSIYFDAYGKVNSGNNRLSFIKDSAFYEIYLSFRNIARCRPSIKWLYTAPATYADGKWFSVYYERFRMLALLKNLFAYRQLLRRVRNASWLKLKAS